MVGRSAKESLGPDRESDAESPRLKNVHNAVNLRVIWSNTAFIFKMRFEFGFCIQPLLVALTSTLLEA